MKEHMRARQISDYKDDYYSYESKTLTGRIRRYCSKNSACNFRFQGLVSDGTKYALWELYQRDFWVFNFVHDRIWSAA